MDYKLRGDFSKDENCIIDILKNRNVPNVEAFLYPNKQYENDPYLLDNIDAAADLLLKHLRADHTIAILADADCDGFTSAAILWNYIKQIFPQADLHYLLHNGKQHGLEDQIEMLENEQFCDLLIAPDAASYDVEYFWRLNAIKIDVIALDHHTQEFLDDGTPIVNDCPTAIVVNNQLSANYPNKDFCGAGITYQFCKVLDDKLGIELAQNFIDLAAVGNIGDVMFQGDPETRYIIVEGLHNIQNPGIRALLEAQSYSLKEKATPPYPGLTPIDVAFYICPLINAVVRVGTQAEKEVLFAALIDPQKEFPSTKRGARPGDTETAVEQAARITKNIKARQDRAKEKALNIIDFKIQKEGLDQNNIIFIEITPEDNIPNELTGLIAQNVVSKYGKPCLLGRKNYQNEVQGSIRNDGNFKGLPSFKTFLEQSGLMTFTAGHLNAAGFGIKAAQVEDLIKYANEKLNTQDFINCYLVDYILSAKNSSANTVLYTLASHPDCYGNGVDEPRIIIKDIPLNDILVMGNNKDCMKISCNGIDYVRFKDIDFIQEVMGNRMQTLTVYGRANLNHYMNKTSIQLFIDDYELVEDVSRFDF